MSSVLIALNSICKRIMDIVIAIMASIFFFPIWIILYLLIEIDSPGSALYLHTRVGRNKKHFTCFKFRTMRTDADPNKLAESKEDDRITKLGHFLRKTSLDETPQLLNVILGDMSIVGPRPALPVQVEHFNQQDLKKLLVKPGLTGWTQVNGRNSIPYEKRLELDAWYAEHHNIFLDIFIILKTFKVLAFGDGIYDPNSTSPIKNK
jgi:lipopolysaccharide/colanic/teichoic acid biosynthesis glycosyltransferase